MILKSSILALGMIFSSCCLAEGKMDLDMPNLPEQVRETMSANLAEGFSLDDQKMNAQLLAQDYEIAEAYIDEEFLSDLDLNEIPSFDAMTDGAILDDK